ncbi:MAG TPA: inorganic diphosphatase [Candidatus Sulfotelmatobacter sp.]|jgi:inorganic pyrophosphatase|nr:inorganic diphosphatase [Candidatus Sulfotelmatobacter sp.]
MPNYNKLLTPGNIDEGWINTIVDIPEGSTLKIEYDRQHGIFMLDRVEPAVFPKPVNYGFIPATKDTDGDELDVLLVCHEPIPTGVLVKAKIIGIFNFEDDGDMDYKIVCVPVDDRNTGDSITTIDDLGKRWKQKIEFHFAHYKDLKKPGTTKVLGWGDLNEAKKIILECIERYKKEGFSN